MLSLYEKSCPQPLSLQYAQLRLCSDHQQTSSRAGWRFVDDLKPPVFYRNPAFILTLDKYTLDKFLPHGQSGLFYLDSPDAGMDRKNRRPHFHAPHRAFHRPAGGFCFHPAQYRYSPRPCADPLSSAGVQKRGKWIFLLPGAEACRATSFRLAQRPSPFSINKRQAR